MVKSGSYLRRMLLLLASSSIALKKDSKVESSNRKYLGKRLQHTGGRVTSQKLLKILNEGFCFTQENIWEEKKMPEKQNNHIFLHKCWPHNT